jgi:hypothetical protein
MSTLIALLAVEAGELRLQQHLVLDKEKRGKKPTWVSLQTKYLLSPLSS